MPSFFLLLWKQLVNSSLLQLPILRCSIETMHQHLIPGLFDKEEYFPKRSLRDKQKVSPDVPITLHFFLLWKLKSILTDTKHYKESLTQSISKTERDIRSKHSYMRQSYTYSSSLLFNPLNLDYRTKVICEILDIILHNFTSKMQYWILSPDK